MAKAREIPDLDCAAGAREAAGTVLRVRFDEVLAFREAALDSSEPEGVHDMRVAIRRLRSALKNFSALIEKETYKKFKQRLKEVAGALGAVRDEDVAIETFELLKGKTENQQIKEGLAAIVAERRQLREPARRELQTVLGEKELGALEREFERMIRELTDPAGASDDLTLKECGRRVLAAELERFCRLSAAIYNPADGERLHKFRIAAKRLRYALELFAVCWENQTVGFAKEIAGMQSFLGKVHDCDVQIAALTRRRAAPDAVSRTGRETIEWLLARFFKKRTKNYFAALGLWSDWQADDLIGNLRAVLKLN